MASVEIELIADTRPLSRAVDQLVTLSGRLSELDFHSLGETGKFALQILDGAPDLGQAIAFDVDSSALRTGAIAVSVQPSKLFLDLLSALRAVDGEVDGIDHCVHGDSFPERLIG